MVQKSAWQLPTQYLARGSVLFAIFGLSTIRLLLCHDKYRLQLDQYSNYYPKLGCRCRSYDLGGIEAKLARASSSVRFTVNKKYLNFRFRYF